MFSGTLLLMQASYLAMYSSHSGTPILSADGAAAVLAGAVLAGAVLAALVVAVLPVLVFAVLVVAVLVLSPPPHATSSAPAIRHPMRTFRVLVFRSRLSFTVSLLIEFYLLDIYSRPLARPNAERIASPLSIPARRFWPPRLNSP